MGLPRYIINFDELIDRIGNDLSEYISGHIKDKIKYHNLNNVNALLDILKDNMPYKKYLGITKKIKEIIIFHMQGDFKIRSACMDLPAIKNQYTHNFKFEKDVYLTSMHINQTGWKKNDRIDLIIDKNKIINNKTTKEIGEHIYFNTFFKVNSQMPISFILKNKSGNSRQVLIDLEYMQGDVSTINPPVPVKPTIYDIPNDWDWCFQLDWEENSEADLDLHAIMSDGTHIFFGNKSQNDAYLNFDTRNHIDNCNSEILSVKGNYDKTLKIYVDNYNKIPLTKDFTIKVYRKISGKIIREYKKTSLWFGHMLTLDMKNYILKVEGDGINE